MQMTVGNPAHGVYPASDDDVHALVITGAQRLLFISGTMGLETGGAAPDDLEKQLRLIRANPCRTLASAGTTTGNLVRPTSHLRDPAYAQANREARIVARGDRRIRTTAIVVRTLDPSWLVEIAAIAAR